MLHADRRFRRPLTVLLAIIIGLWLLPPSAARAQAMDGLFPSPISTPELAEYFLRLNASSDQQQAIMRMHDRYQADFRRLRENELAAVMDQMNAMQAEPVMPDPKDLAAMARAMETGGQQIVRIDNRFFDEIQGTLSPAQSARMVRLRQARDRVRSQSGQAGMMMMGGVQGLELENVLRRRGIDPAKSGYEAVDAILDTYERRLTADLAKLAKEAGSFMFDIVEALESAGVAPGTNLMEDPEEMTRLMEMTQAVVAERMSGQQRLVQELRDLAMTAARQIAAMLEPVDGAGIRRAIIGEVYNELSWGFVSHMGNQDFLWNVERLTETMDDGPAQRVRGKLSEITMRVDRLIDQSVEAIKERDAGMSMFDFDGDSWQEYHSLNTERQTQVQTMYADLAAVLDEIDKETNAGKAWRQRLAGTQDEGMVSMVAEMSEAEVEEQAEVARHWTADWAIPSRMGQLDVRDLRILLSLDDGEASIVDQLHREYVESYRALEGIETLRKLTPRLWSADPESGAAQLDAEGVGRLRTARRNAAEEVLALDGEFFDAVDISVGNPQRKPLIDALRQSRKLFAFNRTAHIWMAPSHQDDQEWQVNPLRIVLRDRNIVGDERTQAAMAFQRRAGELVEGAQRQFMALLDAQYHQERWQVSQRSGNFDYTGYNDLRRETAGYVSTMATARTEMARVVRDQIDEVCAHLGRDSSERIRDEYNRRAFPSIFAAGSLNVEPFLRRALELPDLSARQREDVMELLSTYRPGYDRLSEEMVALVRRIAEEQAGLSSAVAADQTSEWRMYAEFSRDIERLRHDRNELTNRSLMELRALLSESQLAAVGPMPDLASMAGN